MNRIVKIFMERDGMDEYEAKATFNAIKRDILYYAETQDAEEAYDSACDELMLYSLEPDYLDDILF